MVYYIILLYQTREVLLQRSLPIAKQAVKVHNLLHPTVFLV